MSIENERHQSRRTRLLPLDGALLLSLFLLFPLRPLAGAWGQFLMFVKTSAGALSPALAAIGVVRAVLGVLCRDGLLAVSGLVTAVISSRYIARSSRPHNGLAQAFGADWPERIPAAIAREMLPQRWTPLLPAPPPAIFDQDIVFGRWPESGDPLLADLWQPAAGTPRSGLAVIYLHGSGWHYLDKDYGTRFFFGRLAAQGHVVMDVAYTLAPKANVVAMTHDVKRAIAWLKANSDRYQINPDRIVLMGGSAGGHLALLAAYTPNHPRLQPARVETDTSVRAVVGYYPLVDLVDSYEYFRFNQKTGDLPADATGRQILTLLLPLLKKNRFVPPYGGAYASSDFLPNLFGGTPEEKAELYRLGSPSSHVGAHCPPTLLLQGAHDFGGMVGQVRRLRAALEAAGVPVVHVEFAETDHAFDLVLPRFSPPAQASFYDLERFLALMV